MTGVERTDIQRTFSRGVNISHAEEFAKELSRDNPPSRRVCVDLSKCEHVDPGAGARIGNALRRHAAADLVTIIVPQPMSSSTSFDVLVRSGLGFHIARRATLIVGQDGRDATADFRAQYDRRRTHVAKNHVVVPDIHVGSVVNVEDFSAFVLDFASWLPSVNTSREVFDIYDRSHSISRSSDAGSFLSLARLAFEGTQNTYDHAARQPFTAEQSVVSYLSLSYRKQWWSGHGAVGGFRRFYERARDLIGSTTFAGIEITVLDDGCGVAARFAGDENIYFGRTEVERLALEAALKFGSSVKLTSQDAPIRGDPGYGITHITQSLSRLGGYASLRTGRFTAVYDGTEQDAKSFVLVDASEGYIPGTILHAVVPIPVLQLSLGLR